MKGEGIVAFVALKDGFKESSSLIDELRIRIREDVSPIATPERIIIIPALPKTRSGKIMRRLLRKLAIDPNTPRAELGDVSTLSDPHVVDQIIAEMNRKPSK